jgi:hypothetical protein
VIGKPDLYSVRGALLLGYDESADLEAAVLLIQDARQNATALDAPPSVRGGIPGPTVYTLSQHSPSMV